MVTRPSDVLLWYGFTMCITTVWCFPDGAIGKKYILAKTGDGGYALVSDETKIPGIHVSPHEIHYVSTQTPDKPIKTVHVISPPFLTNSATAAPVPPASIKISAHDSNPLPVNLNKENSGSTNEENLVTLALQGRDGVNGKPGPKGPPGESGPTGGSGSPGLQGEPGTCSISQFECNVNLIKNLTARVTQLEKILAKVKQPHGAGQGN